MSRRQRQVEVDTGPQDDWIWGNQRGGGGAPIKDTAGNQINNLKKVVKGDVVVDTSPKAQGRRAISFKEELRPSEDHYEYNYRSKSFRDDKRNNRPPIDDRAQNIQQVPMHAPASPRKFMGALQSMHGNNQENQAKLRREQEYQDALRRQIEEKQRKKEEEKKREEDLKKKELEEYLTIHYKGDLPAHVQKQLKPPDNRKEDRRNNDDREHERRDNPPRRRPVDKSCRDEQDDDDEPNDYRRKPDKTTNRRDPAEEFSDYDRRRDNYDDVRGSMEYDDDEPPSYGNKHKKLSEKGRRGKQDREFYDDQSSDPSDNFSSDRRYQENDYDSPKRKGKAKQKKKGIADELDDYGEKKWVSMKEYDELSQLCDKLLNQQDKLQSEIQKQAELIKNLEAKSSQLKGLAKPERGNPFRQKNIDDKGNHQLPPTGMKNGKVASTAGERRSRSVQQARQNNDGCAERDSSTTRRPSSISSNRDGVQPLKGPPTKHKKVAGLGFGSAVGRNLSKQKEKDANGKNGRVVRSDSNDNNSNALPAKKSQMTGVNVIGNQGRLRVDTVGADRKQQLISRVYSDEGGSPKNAAGGFAKLQLQAANSRRIVGGPQIVLHEEDSSGYNGKATGRSIELSGQSEYIKIPAAESDILGGDQLDALLKQARRARN